jgi:uncharacterized protein YjbJ (UPF0337 family)
MEAGHGGRRKARAKVQHDYGDEKQKEGEEVVVEAAVGHGPGSTWS